MYKIINTKQLCFNVSASYRNPLVTNAKSSFVLTGTMAKASLSSREEAQPTLDMIGLSASVSRGIEVE